MRVVLIRLLLEYKKKTISKISTINFVKVFSSCFLSLIHFSFSSYTGFGTTVMTPVFFFRWETQSYTEMYVISLVHPLQSWDYFSTTSIFPKYLMNAELWPVVDLLRRNPHWWSPIIASAYGVNLDSRMLHKSLHAADKSEMPYTYYSLSPFFFIYKCVQLSAPYNVV